MPPGGKHMRESTPWRGPSGPGEDAAVTDRRVQAYLRKGSRPGTCRLHGHGARFIADLSDIQKR
jgi:hypothetical protein